MASSPKEFQFPTIEDLKEAGYRVFPSPLEDDELVFFHATLAQHLTDIINDGFRSAKELEKGELDSVSYAKQSPMALGHVCKPGQPVDNEFLIIAVRFEDTVLHRVNASDMHVFNGTQPEIIGVCRIPRTYVHA
ncbi:hypothetical protein HW571_22575 [Agrobacterium genomosp. 3]|uniref:hypothetical protein n=1 Tax=Agrobacterium tomkonis TaxID=1183410 RepID=UPI001CD8BA57|nr:hypothetical protein [Agrobacterium tomkonis]MCA1878892.1 hypothetical protein [Agrobacterium tumefaciens]MCA1894115.1 hypothetical protein [Agrobacterium tomkonis]